MNSVVTLLLLALLCLLAYGASKLIRKLTGRSYRLTKLGYLILIVGFLASTLFIVALFPLDNSQRPLYFGAIAGIWSLVAQFFTGIKE